MSMPLGALASLGVGEGWPSCGDAQGPLPWAPMMVLWFFVPRAAAPSLERVCDFPRGATLSWLMGQLRAGAAVPRAR